MKQEEWEQFRKKNSSVGKIIHIFGHVLRLKKLTAYISMTRASMCNEGVFHHCRPSYGYSDQTDVIAKISL